MHERQRRGDTRRIRRVRHAHEERQPLDRWLGHPGLRALRVVGHAGVERVADVGLHRERDPDVGISERKEGTEEPPLRDADHDKAGAADDELAADDRGVPLKAAPPVRVADDHDRAGAHAGRVSRLDQPARLRALTEALEEPPGDELYHASLRRAHIGAPRDAHLHLRRRRRGKHLGAVLELLPGSFNQRPRIAGRDFTRGILLGGVELLRVRNRKIPKHDRVEHREHRCRSADPSASESTATEATSGLRSSTRNA
jgi:hypothetical protein